MSRLAHPALGADFEGAYLRHVTQLSKDMSRILRGLCGSPLQTQRLKILVFTSKH